jgi:hypothetical protein
MSISQVMKIDRNSNQDEVEDFYSLYVESFKNLCIWKGEKIINLGEYLKPSSDKNEFIEDLIFVVRGLGLIIYYTHNDDVITSIAFVEIEPLSKCYVTLKFLCGNQETREETQSESGKTQGINMLDFIFNKYKDSLILIEPANPALIGYYTKYKKPSFPYVPSMLKETRNFLIYGNLSHLRENCFQMIFRSITIINNMVNTLHFNSINDLYQNTNSLTTLKDKLITKLDFLVKTKQMKPYYYEEILQKIIDIKFYDIEDILLFSKSPKNSLSESYLSTKSGGKKVKRNKKTKNQKKIKSKTIKRRLSHM